MSGRGFVRGRITTNLRGFSQRGRGRGCDNLAVTQEQAYTDFQSETLDSCPADQEAEAVRVPHFEHPPVFRGRPPRARGHHGDVALQPRGRSMGSPLAVRGGASRRGPQPRGGSSILPHARGGPAPPQGRMRGPPPGRGGPPPRGRAGPPPLHSQGLPRGPPLTQGYPRGPAPRPQIRPQQRPPQPSAPEHIKSSDPSRFRPATRLPAPRQHPHDPHDRNDYYYEENQAYSEDNRYDPSECPNSDEPQEYHSEQYPTSTAPGRSYDSQLDHGHWGSQARHGYSEEEHSSPNQVQGHQYEDLPSEPSTSHGGSYSGGEDRHKHWGAENREEGSDRWNYNEHDEEQAREDYHEDRADTWGQNEESYQTADKDYDREALTSRQDWSRDPGKGQEGRHYPEHAAAEQDRPTEYRGRDDYRSQEERQPPSDEQGSGYYDEGKKAAVESRDGPYESRESRRGTSYGRDAPVEEDPSRGRRTRPESPQKARREAERFISKSKFSDGDAGRHGSARSSSSSHRPRDGGWEGSRRNRSRSPLREGGREGRRDRRSPSLWTKKDYVSLKAEERRGRDGDAESLDSGFRDSSSTTRGIQGSSGRDNLDSRFHERSPRSRDRGGSGAEGRRTKDRFEREGESDRGGGRDRSLDLGSLASKDRDRETFKSRERTRDRGHDRERFDSSRDRGSASSRRRDDRVDRGKDRKNNRSPPEQNTDRAGKAKEMANAEPKVGDEEKAEEEEEDVPAAWVRCSPADLYFKHNMENHCMEATRKMQDLQAKFDHEILDRATRVRAGKPKVEKPSRQVSAASLVKKHCCGGGAGSEPEDEEKQEKNADNSDGGSSSSDESVDPDIEQSWLDELNRKKTHPERLHEELWFNEPGEMNDGPLCQCSSKARQTGLRHNKYPGEKPLPKCNPHSSNAVTLHHYRITMSPHTNFLTKNPTLIEYDNHEYIFEGFSLFSHYRLEKIPVCKVIRFNIQYTIHHFEEPMPENFDIRSMDQFSRLLFFEMLEMYDLDWLVGSDGCCRFHILPRFARDLPDNGKEILSMNEVLSFLLRSSRPLVEEHELSKLVKYSQTEWQEWVDQVRGMVVMYPGMRPSALRIDQLDREEMTKESLSYPKIIHFGVRPAQLSYAGDPSYQKTWKVFMKLRHLVANKPKVTGEDRERLSSQEEKLQEIRLKGSMKREVTVEISSKGYVRTGIRSDMCQHALLLPVLIVHLRFHKCLDLLEQKIDYVFKDRCYLQLALTHPSYRLNFGTNPDHTRNSLSNCGMRQLEYGDRKVHYVHTRKRGINTLIHIMAKLGRKEATQSQIKHYERLEFLGDAVVEFLASIHLFYMFPNMEEGGLATYRSALVQNQHLSVLAKKLLLQDYMLYVHGPDLCQAYDLRHAMANCFEAMMAALLLDGGIELADRVFATTLFANNEKELHGVWTNLPLHVLQDDEPNGDRHWIESSPPLQKMAKFEDATGIKFGHIRLLARAFTMRNVGFNNLTLGHNQRLEFLGDTVLQFIASDFLFRHFPEHHEGHLSLLRSSLVNNRTQAVVGDDLGMTEFIINNDPRLPDKTDLRMKEKADLLEAFIGALYVDKGLDHCTVFANVCFFPRLKQFIMNQDWNDPKSQLQQCCLTLRDLDEEEPDIPVYKVIQSTGPTNTRKYTVAVYFRGDRLATGVGHSIQQAQMDAASNALTDKASLFPHLIYQKMFLYRKFKKYKQLKKKPAQPSPQAYHRGHARPSTQRATDD